jgi:hypothetical protein
VGVYSTVRHNRTGSLLGGGSSVEAMMLGISGEGFVRRTGDHQHDQSRVQPSIIDPERKLKSGCPRPPAVVSFMVDSLFFSSNRECMDMRSSDITLLEVQVYTLHIANE